MKTSLTASSAWLHTWVGLVFGWLLFAIFFTGTVAVFRNEVTAWMNPELSRPGDQVRGVAVAEARLREVAQHAREWTIIPPDARQSAVQISWTTKPTGSGEARAQGRETIDPQTGQSASIRDTLGGDLFYRFHYNLELPNERGWWISGAAGIVMLVTLVSGVIIHKRIFKDLFTFRPRAGARRAWLDAHNVLGVLTLPFHLVITYTGLVPMLSIVLAAGVMANYRGDTPVVDVVRHYDDAYSAYIRERRIPPLVVRHSGTSSPLTSLMPVVEQANAHWNSQEVGRIDVHEVGDSNARVEVTRHESAQLSDLPERLVFDGTNGRFISVASDVGPAVRTFSVLWGLHVVRFAGPLVRWAYFLMGLASSALIATGLLFWVVKRREMHAVESVGQHLVERLNVGFIIGLPVAVACYFCANRLLPLDIHARAAVEKGVFFAVWGLLVGLAMLRSPERAWREGFALMAMAFGAVPVLNALTTNRHLFASLAAGDWVFAGFDLTMLAVAALSTLVWHRLAVHAAALSRRATPLVGSELETA